MHDGVGEFLKLHGPAHETSILEALGWEPLQGRVVGDHSERRLDEERFELPDSPNDSEALPLRRGVVALGDVELPADESHGVLSVFVLLGEDAGNSFLGSVGLQGEGLLEVGCMQAGSGEEGILELLERELRSLMPFEGDAFLGECVERPGHERETLDELVVVVG